MLFKTSPSPSNKRYVSKGINIIEQSIYIHMSGNNLSLKDELLLLSSINKHRNSRIQKRLSYLEKESSSGNDNNNEPHQLQSRDDDTYFDVDDNSVVTEQVSCHRRTLVRGERQKVSSRSTTFQRDSIETPSIITEHVNHRPTISRTNNCKVANGKNSCTGSLVLKSEALSTTASIRKATPEINNGRGRDSPETIRTEFIATSRRPTSIVSQRHVNNYSPISIQTEMVSSRVQSNKHNNKGIEKQQGDSGHHGMVVEKKKEITKQSNCNQDTIYSGGDLNIRTEPQKSSTASPTNKSNSSIRHVKKPSSVSSSSTKQKSKSRSFFTRGKKATSKDRKVANSRQKNTKSQTNSKGMKLELNKKPQQSSAMQRKISDRYLKNNVGRDIVSIKEEEEIVDTVLMKIPPNKVAVVTSPLETAQVRELDVVVKQQNEVKVAEQKRQQVEQQLKIYQKNAVSSKNKEDTQRKDEIIKVRERKEIEYRKCLETALSVANMEVKQAEQRQQEMEKQLTQQIEQAEIEKQRSIADELKRIEMAEQVKQIMQLETSLANHNKILSDKVEYTEEQLKITADMLSKYQNELEQVKAIKVNMPDVSTATSASSSFANKVENEHADLKREVERIVQEEILRRVSTESINDLVDDELDTSGEEPVETNLTTYTSYEIDPSIVHDISNDDSGGCFGWLCCAGGEEKLDKSSWYDASSVSSGSEGVGQCDSKLDRSSVSYGSLGVRVV